MSMRMCASLTLLSVTWSWMALAQPILLTTAEVVTTSSEAAVETCATVLVEEVERRTGLRWPITSSAGSETAVILDIDAGTAPGPEGYAVNATLEGRVTITGADARGLLFGVGRLLRALEWAPGKAQLPEAMAETSRPDYPIRGHQLGYRARANSWDAWTPEQFDQFIRELALFGTNAIENIPFQDDQPSPHMKLSRPEMNKKLSEICARYDLDYWVWTPADYDLKDPAKRAAGLEAHEAFYADCPRLDGVFFPGGDPGDNHPRDVMPFLEDVAKLLAKHHPKAKVWLSPQGFGRDEVDYVFAWLDEHKPTWFGGLVGGPSSPPLDGLRARLDKRYQLRDYPDITHIVRCQYPALTLDQAFALTLGRECIMARPVFYTYVHGKTAPFTDGFISYSDGVHDDANKVLWSQLGWNARKDPRDILVEYCRFFFGPDVAEAAADGILALEKNWDGPIRLNGAIEGTLAQWRALEAAHPELKDNWRWQMYVCRAYYDAYTRARAFRESALELEANRMLVRAGDRSPQQAIADALAVLSRVDAQPTRPDLRERIVTLYDDLYHSIGLQTDTKKHQASGTERGCSLEFLDYPLNNRWWLEDEFKKVEALTNEDAQWARLEELRTWEDPGPGGFYDDLGHIGRSPHVLWDLGATPWSGGFAWWDNGYSRARLSWQVTSWPRNGLEYTGLDPAARYVLRFTGFGDMTAFADEKALEPTRYGTAEGDIKEYPVPAELVQDGRLKVTLQPKRLEGVNWRFQPRLSEAWLIRKGP